MRRACSVLGAQRSSYRSVGKGTDQADLKQRIKEIAETRVRYCYRRIHVLLQREGRGQGLESLRVPISLPSPSDNMGGIHAARIASGAAAPVFAFSDSQTAAATSTLSHNFAAMMAAVGASRSSSAVSIWSMPPRSCDDSVVGTSVRCWAKIPMMRGSVCGSGSATIRKQCLTPRAALRWRSAVRRFRRQPWRGRGRGAMLLPGSPTRVGRSSRPGSPRWRRFHRDIRPRR